MAFPRTGNPSGLQRAIDRAFEADPNLLRAVGAPQEKPAPRPASPLATDWESYVASLGTLPESNARLSIWLPGLQMISFNAAMRGEAGDKKRNRIAVQNSALRACKEAYMQATQPLHRFTMPVAVTVYQCGARRAIDVGNLYHKPVIDCLLTRGGGLGVIADDSAKFIVSLRAAYGEGQLVGVRVEVEVATK